MKSVIFFIIMVASTVMSGCGAPDGINTAPAETSRISTMEDYNSRYGPGHIDSAQAWDLFQTHSSSIMLDVRTEASYNENHVSIAVNVPYEQITDYAEQNLPDKDMLIVCYCFCDDKGGSALSAYNLLSDMGYTQVYYTDPGGEWAYEGTSPAGNMKDGSVHNTVSGAQAWDIYENNSGAILLDVRNPDEYAQGHIEGSVLIPVSELEKRMSELPDKDAVIIVYCRGGVRSAAAYEILAAGGYTQVFDMQQVTNWPEPLVTR